MTEQQDRDYNEYQSGEVFSNLQELWTHDEQKETGTFILVFSSHCPSFHIAHTERFALDEVKNELWECHSGASCQKDTAGVEGQTRHWSDAGAHESLMVFNGVNTGATGMMHTNDLLYRSSAIQQSKTK
ncbi:hypothetical protein E2C01_011672 [Portunus trituberculatus]|uniref:Uncharacterized protein n=1 Tax=Portunus trituberculatus TaxID=210409 RepID=A0A5B7DBY7_PORTR|nr:hypothetical protein [Portunus trituberculatus]